MNYLKSAAWVIVPLFVLSLLVSLLYYFGIFPSSVNNVFKIIVPALSFLVGGVYLGKHSAENGWLEGLKLGGAFVILSFIISYLAFDIGLSLKSTVYYIILLFSAMLGAMFGIRNVEKPTS